MSQAVAAFVQRVQANASQAEFSGQLRKRGRIGYGIYSPEEDPNDADHDPAGEERLREDVRGAVHGNRPEEK